MLVNPSTSSLTSPTTLTQATTAATADTTQAGIQNFLIKDAMTPSDFPVLTQAVSLSQSVASGIDPSTASTLASPTAAGTVLMPTDQPFLFRPAPDPGTAPGMPPPPGMPPRIDPRLLQQLPPELRALFLQIQPRNGFPPPPPPGQRRFLLPSGTQTTGSTTNSTVTQRVNDPNKITVAQIDSFTPDDQDFNHGEEIAKTIEAGGDDPSLAGQINLIQYHIDGTGPLATTLSKRTGDALEDIVKRVKSGEDIDAVNMSLQDFTDSAATRRVRTLVDQLAHMNVAVNVAAGNAGPTFVNQLTTPDAFVVQSATNGKLNATSSLGNITGEASTTSFATATVTPRIAEMINSGMTVDQVRALVGLDPIT
jgi:hypothetical protein